MPLHIKWLCPLLEVFNMRRSIAFYRDVLGFEIVSDSGGGDDASWVWLKHGEINLMLNDQYEPGHVPAAPPPERQKWHKDTCLYFGADPDSAYEYLLAKGFESKPPTDAPYGMRQLYLQDPDGYNICFQQPVKNE